MNKTGAFQATFAGGMIEGIKQDQPFERNDGGLSSVLWLENYNHTLQEDSAIKRWGEVDSGVPLLDLGYFCPNEVYSGVVNGGNDYEVNRAALLQGVQMYSVVHPQHNDNITAFLKRYPNTTTGYSNDFIPQWIIDEGTLESSEAVSVVSYTLSKDGEIPEWQEVWADGNLDYPGWYTFGSLADVTRYGETLLFTTTLDDLPYFQADGTKNPVNDYLYPVYRYLYWDIRKKWKNNNMFLNGIGTYEDSQLSNPANASKFAKWKILPPAQYVINNTTVGITNGIVSATEATNYDGSTTKYDINISIEECEYVGYKNGMLPKSSTNTVYTPPWIEEDYNYVTEGGKKALIPSQELSMLESVNLPKMNIALYGSFDYYRNLYNSAGAIYGTGSLVRNIPAQISGNGIDPIDTFLVVDGAMLGTSLTKYTESLSPRLWMYSEKLDFVLTANIGGIETVLWRGDYEVQRLPRTNAGTDPFYAYDLPSVFKVTAYDEMPYLEIVMPNESEYSTILRGGNFYPQGKGVGTVTSNYYAYYYYGTILYFTIAVKQSTMELLVDSSCTSLSLWCVKPDSNRHILNSVGNTSEKPSGNIYNKPQEQGNENVDYTKYALLKKFVIDGRTDAVTSYENWIPSATLATNAWKIHFDSLDTYYVAVPLYSMEQGQPVDREMTLPIYPNQEKIQLYLDDPVANNFWELDYWTPDFVIWDYPTETTLFLNSSGKYWKGLGAKLITVIKGRTFIGGCIGADGIEEQAILRYSDVQGGAISPDIFSEERKIQVGHMPHTALLEFREQLWAFSRYQFYRIGMASITQEETWEFFDVVEQGCFNVKSAIVVPYGVCFCNEAGVWLSEGGEPQNLALPILPTYQHISSGTQYLYTTINQLDGVPYIDEKGINPYMELNYDSFNDEILISSPLFTVVQNDDNNTDYLPNTDFTMIFSFKYKTWRIESSVVPPYELEIQ